MGIESHVASITLTDQTFFYSIIDLAVTGFNHRLLTVNTPDFIVSIDPCSDTSACLTHCEKAGLQTLNLNQGGFRCDGHYCHE